MKIKMSQLRRIIREELSRQREIEEAKLSWIGGERLSNEPLPEPSDISALQAKTEAEPDTDRDGLMLWALPRGYKFDSTFPPAWRFSIDEDMGVIYGLNAQGHQVWVAEIPPRVSNKITYITFSRMPVKPSVLAARHKYSRN